MKRPAAIAIAVACVAAVVLCGVRVAHVNSAYPEQNAYAYSLGEEATYSGQDSSGGVVERGSVTVRAENTELLDYEGLKSLVPGYADSLVDDGTSQDMRAFLVEVEISNDSSEAKKVHVRDFKAQSGAWANGLYAPVYMTLNDDPSTIINMEPGEKARRTLVYLMYDMQFDGDRWKDVGDRRFELVLALYPDKYFVDLGVPSSGGLEGGVA